MILSDLCIHSSLSCKFLMFYPFPVIFFFIMNLVSHVFCHKVDKILYIVHYLDFSIFFFPIAFLVALCVPFISSSPFFLAGRRIPCPGQQHPTSVSNAVPALSLPLAGHLHLFLAGSEPSVEMRLRDPGHNTCSEGAFWSDALPVYA